MLDIHPQPERSQVEVRVGERSVDVGHLDGSSLISAIHAARKILASTIADGLFVDEEETEFEFLSYFDSIDEWTSYWANSRFAEPVADEPLMEATCALMSQGEGEILMRELARAVRLKRLG